MSTYAVEFVEVEREGELESRSQVLDWVWKTSKRILVENGSFEPALVLVKPKSIVIVRVGKFFANNESRRVFVEFVRNLTSQPDVQGYIFATEVWYVFGEEGVVLKPSEHSDKKEALFLQSEWVDGEEVRKSAEICRDGGQISFKTIELGSKVDGILCKLMTKRADQ